MQSQQNDQQANDNPPSSIMGGHNEQANLIMRNNN
jgi:hypothetical protein